MHQPPEEGLLLFVLVDPGAPRGRRQRGGDGAVVEEDLAVVRVDEVVVAGWYRPRPKTVTDQRVGLCVTGFAGRQVVRRAARGTTMPGASLDRRPCRSSADR